MEQATLTELSDKRLIEAYVGGDGEAFSHIVRRHGPMVLGYLRKMTRSFEQAEDCFQETFKRVHEKAHMLRGDNFRSWLYRIATNTAIDSLRVKKRTQEVAMSQLNDCPVGNYEALTETAAADGNCNPTKEAIRTEQREQVRLSINKLPAKQRATLVLAYYQQLNYCEVAEILGCSVGTVKTHIFRALRTLAKSLPDLAGETE